MTETQISLVKKTWKLLRSIDPILIGGVFYGKLFLDAPQLKALFRHPVEAQSGKLISMLSMIVSRLHCLDEITGDINRLAVGHIQYGVRDAHYTAVGNALLWTLEQGLGKDWDEQTKLAWTACFQTLANSMKMAARVPGTDPL
ncbi:MAG: hemoglobin [Williamsia sp.]|nr:hemoglobin [Williamsia sp.]